MNLTDDPKPDSITETMKVVPINPAIAGELEIAKKKLEKARKCPGKHKHVVVDEQLRTVTCDDCGFVVDAFDYILEWAAEGERRMDGLRRIEIQRRIAQAEHDDLTRKVKNMRSVLKRGGQPQPGVERNHFDMMRWNPHLVEGLDSENSIYSPTGAVICTQSEGGNFKRKISFNPFNVNRPPRQRLHPFYFMMPDFSER